MRLFNGQFMRNILNTKGRKKYNNEKAKNRLIKGILLQIFFSFLFLKKLITFFHNKINVILQYNLQSEHEEKLKNSNSAVARASKNDRAQQSCIVVAAISICYCYGGGSSTVHNAFSKLSKTTLIRKSSFIFFTYKCISHETFNFQF